MDAKSLSAGLTVLDELGKAEYHQTPYEVETGQLASGGSALAALLVQAMTVPGRVGAPAAAGLLYVLPRIRIDACRQWALHAALHRMRGGEGWFAQV